MALLVTGMTCKICRKKLESRDDLILFPPFVSNDNDPLRFFSDGAFHQDCLVKHPLGARAEAQLRDFNKRTGPGHRECIVCHSQILDPDNYISLGYLTDDATDTLSAFNYAHLHRTCLHQFRDRQVVIDQIQARLQSGQWKGKGLDCLVKALANT